MNTKVKKTIIISSILIVFFTLLVVGSIWDFEISKNLVDLDGGQYYSENKFGLFFEIIGEFPLYILLSVSMLIFLFNINKIEESKNENENNNRGDKNRSGNCQNVKKERTNSYAIDTLVVDKKYRSKKINNFFCSSTFVYGLKIVFFLGGVASIFVFLWRASSYAAEHSGQPANTSWYIILILILVSCLFNLMMFFIFKRFKKETIKKLLLFAIIIIFSIMFANLITQGIKIIFGRIRFRTMNYKNDFSLYTPWYKVNFRTSIPEGDMVEWYKSFPSGHTTAAGSIFTTTILCDMFKKLNTKLFKILFWFISIFYVFIVALSRIIVGAHFFTDVLFGAGISLGVFFLVRFCFYKFQSKIIVEDK